MAPVYNTVDSAYKNTLGGGAKLLILTVAR